MELKNYSMRKADRNFITFWNRKTEIINEIKNTLAELFGTNKIRSVKDYLKMLTDHTDGDKLEMIKSLSTSPLFNHLCVMRSSVKGLICHECYSVAYNNYRKPLSAKLARNTAKLTQEIIDDKYIPFINELFFRIESFGDLQNVTQAINYLKLILKNSHVSFAWWTKNPQYIKQALETLGIEKPANVQIVFSSPCINHCIDINVIKKVFPFIDKVFTVYTSEYATENNISINCGKLHCINCLNCYKAGGNVQVSELKK